MLNISTAVPNVLKTVMWKCYYTLSASRFGSYHSVTIGTCTRNDVRSQTITYPNPNPNKNKIIKNWIPKKYLSSKKTDLL